MPTIPLYDTSAPPDGYHRVTAPGGYEWWSMVAEDAARETRFTIDFFDGDPFSVAYRRAYARYVRRPTKLPPPLPRDYPVARAMLSEAGVVSRVFRRAFPAGAVRTLDSRPGIAIGASAIISNAGGRVVIMLDGLGLVASRRHPTTLEGQLTFEPDGLVQGEGHVSGVLRERLGEVVRRSIELKGDGRYVHSFSTTPWKPQ